MKIPQEFFEEVKLRARLRNIPLENLKLKSEYHPEVDFSDPQVIIDLLGPFETLAAALGCNLSVHLTPKH